MTVNSITKFRNWLPLHFALRQKCRGFCPPETREPKATDRVDAVSKAGASEMMREVNIRKRFALLYHFSFLIYPLAKLCFALWMGEAFNSLAIIIPSF